MKHLAFALTAAAFSSTLILAGCGGSSHGSNGANQYSESVARVQKLELGLSEYINDYDDVLPTNAGWMDALTPYVKDPTAFRSPAVTNGYGYAFNSAIAGSIYSQLVNPDKIIAIFDSTDLAYNACDTIDTLPKPPRYGTKNTIGYADGTTQDGQLGSPSQTPVQVSVTRVKQLDLGMLIYANDYDDVFPQNNAWMTDLLPYVKQAELFHSPAVEDANPNEYGYAFNSALIQTAEQNIDAPSTTLCLFDSTLLTFNATGSTSTLPNPGRYSGSNTVGYADGHVTTVATSGAQISRRLLR